MTQSADPNRVAYSGNDVTTGFSFPYWVDADTDLAVWLVDADGNETAQALNTHFTVSGTGSASVTVTMVTAPASTESLVIVREQPLVQDLELSTIQQFRAQPIENQMDQIVRALLRVNDVATRALLLRQHDTIGSGAFDAGAQQIQRVADPTAAQHAATKAYVDAYVVAQSLDPSADLFALKTDVDDLSGVTDVATALTNLSLNGNTDLRPLASLNGNGLLARTGAAAFSNRTITGGSGITVSDGDGVSGNPTLALTAGLIAMWGTGTVPSGWLECDGTAVSRTTYATLYAVIGNTYGNGDGSTTFNLPDFRGLFPRGHDDSAGEDPDAASRTDRGDGTTGDNVGTKQADAFQGHYHTYDYRATIRPSGINTPELFDITNAANTEGPATGFEIKEPITDGTNDTPRTTSETRPTNIAVKFIISTG